MALAISLTVRCLFLVFDPLLTSTKLYMWAMFTIYLAVFSYLADWYA
jgi:hypothetical protein